MGPTLIHADQLAKGSKKGSKIAVLAIAGLLFAFGSSLKTWLKVRRSRLIRRSLRAFVTLATRQLPSARHECKRPRAT